MGETHFLYRAFPFFNLMHFKLSPILRALTPSLHFATLFAHWPISIYFWSNWPISIQSSSSEFAELVCANCSSHSHSLWPTFGWCAK